MIIISIVNLIIIVIMVYSVLNWLIYIYIYICYSYNQLHILLH